MNSNIPTKERVAETLLSLDGSATALAVCDKLVSLGHPRPDSQLGIQRAISDRAVLVAHDLSLYAVPSPVL